MGQFVPESVQTGYANARDVVRGVLGKTEEPAADKVPASEEEPPGDWGVREAQEANRTEASMFLETNTPVQR
ncbi:hypothetical protein IMZ48_41500 [Candidatus Bathyarchaeota archaeon]|nr:hypothetical protein [Candidatus Bathyarchaeota archaeon]